MLTYPSDSFHQIICPMDEHAIPPNSFCSAPSHSEPPPLPLPCSFITPSCVKNGVSDHRSCHIQEIQAPKKQSFTDQRAGQKPSRQNLVPTKRQRENANMVSKSKHKRVEHTCVHEKQTEDGFAAIFAAQRQNKQNDQKSPVTEENVVEQFAVDTTQNLEATKPEATKPDKDACGRLDFEHSFETASAPKGWVIGPLFQSFKSKMASFTDIVMSPVKLFRDNNPPPCTKFPDQLDESELPATGASDVEHSELSHVFDSEAQSENANQERLQNVETEQNTETDAPKYSKKLSFDVKLPTLDSNQADTCAITQKENNSPDPVPLQHCPLPNVFEEGSESVGSSILQPSLIFCVPPKTKLNRSGAPKDHKGKRSAQLTPLLRKCSVSKSTVKKVTSTTVTSKVKKKKSEVSDEQFSYINSVQSSKADSVCYASPITDCPQHLDGEDDGRKIESLDRSSHLKNLNDSANEETLKPSWDTQWLDCQLNSEMCSASALGRAKRGVDLDCQSQDFVKRKRLTPDTCTNDTERRELLEERRRRRRRRRREVVSTNPLVHEEETLKPVGKRPSVSSRENKKIKNGQEINATIDETVLITLDKSSGVSENNLKDSSRKRKPRDPCKMLKTKTGLSNKPDVNIDNGMELETSMAIASTKQAEQETPSEVFTSPAMKPLQSSSKRRNINKSVKRKSPSQSSSATESDGTLFKSASPCVQKEEGSKKGPTQPSKRTKKSFRVDVKSFALGGSQKTKVCSQDLHLVAKENKPHKSSGKISTNPTYFELTPFGSDKQLSSSQRNVNGSVQSNKEVKHVADKKEKSTASISDELFPTDAEASNHSSISVSESSARRVNINPSTADKKMRKRRVLQSKTCKGEEGTMSITIDNPVMAAPSLPSQGNDLPRRLFRSYSCPEIPSFRLHDIAWTSALHSLHHSRILTTLQRHSSHTPAHHALHKSNPRARRHTVCSVEVEREIIAPLCLRKEVYPSRRSLPYDGVTHHQGLSPSLALSPSSSLSALASCFLTSPLAFLSKKDKNGGSTSPSSSSHVSPPTSCSPMYPMIFLERIDSPKFDYSTSGNLLECQMARRQQREEEDDAEDTSSSSQEFEDVGLREEKALSDSEIKVVQKHEERGKVSSIRIRKALPKPQNNLTPMGLPRRIRLNKKEFSLEEIYTNKNFSYPPESRLETIFEVPHNRRDGSESWYSHRRVKRFMKFLDAGEIRKPKKPLIGNASISSSRSRRGGFPKDKPRVQDVDSLLSAKLDQLKLWLIDDQTDS